MLLAVLFVHNCYESGEETFFQLLLCVTVLLCELSTLFPVHALNYIATIQKMKK